VPSLVTDAGAAVGVPTTRKLFIIARDQAKLYRSLSTALGNEPDVEIVYDRRSANSAARENALEGRQHPDFTDVLRSRGFAVIRREDPEQPGSVRWSA
jgi:hypothetical protein